MIVNSPQNVQSSNPLSSISSRRVVGAARTATTPPNAEDKKVEEARKQQDDTVVRQLRARDREVRAHEAAHTAAGGSLVRGGPSFTLQQGPDGRSYAIGGEVQLDVSEVANDPQATVIKSQRVRQAALAPAQPSSQDFKVAGSASQMAARARLEIAIERRNETQPAETEQQADAAAANETDGTATTDSSAEIQQGSEITPSSNQAVEPTLQSNDAPIAAISAFMATAQSATQPIQINQFA